MVVLPKGVIGLSNEYEIRSLEVAAACENGLEVDVEFIMIHMKNVI